MNVWRVITIGALIVGIAALGLGIAAIVAPDPVADDMPPFMGSTSCLVYREQGCAKQVVASGGELEIQSGGTLDIQAAASLNLGSLYPMLYASAGKQIICGTDTISDTATVTHGLTTPTYALCGLGEDPGTSAGDVAACSTAISGATVTVKGWQDDFSAAANTASIDWCVVGTP